MIILINALLLAGVALPTTHADSTLPPRDTPSRPDKNDKDHADPAVSAIIELNVPAAPAGVWAGVQWQDSGGGWHNVEGWQGPLDSTGNQCWWVAPKDFGTGPFRWVVSPGTGRPFIGTSKPFNLPAGANQALGIEVKVE